MPRRTYCVLLLFLCIAALGGAVRAQTGKTVTIKLLDSRNGEPITPSGFIVRVDHNETVHADWVRKSDSGEWKLTLPPEASLLSVQATYDSAMQMYLNCDSAKDKPNPIDRWYTVADILQSGVAAPNACSKRTAAAKPGEFVVFVRRQNWREQMNSDSHW